MPSAPSSAPPQQDKVNAVIATYISEVVLALEPWAGRLHMPMITPGAASNEITKRVHDDYDHMKYVFAGYLASTQIADAVCDSGKDLLINQMKVKTAVVMSEDAAWTIPLDEEYLKCLPSIGVKVLDHIRLSPDTTDFTPIFNKIEGEKPDVIITGISHVGVQPTVQWQQQQVPIADVRRVQPGDQQHLLEGHQRRDRRRGVQHVLGARRGGDAEDHPLRPGLPEEIRHRAGLCRLHRL